MVLNYIWIAFFLIAFVFGVIALLMGDATIFQKMVDATFDSSKTGFELSLGLTGVLALWLGIMKIGEQAGVVNVLARILSPFFSKLFPDIPKNHPVMGSIFMNIASNMLGLDNAATPTGLKAMTQMQELNTKKDTATNPMIMFSQYLWSNHYSNLYSCFSRYLWGSFAYRCVHSYIVGYDHCYHCGDHFDSNLATYQSSTTHTFARFVGLDRLCWTRYLGL